MAEVLKNIERTLSHSPFNDEQKQLIKKLVASFSVEQIYWLGGFLSGVNALKMDEGPWNSKGNENLILSSESASTKISKPSVTILYGSRTGNGEEIAEKARRIALTRGFNPVLKDMTRFNPDHLIKEKNVLFIVSTHGDGVPPLEAEDLHHYLHNGNALDLKNLKYSICALGDSAYQKFCQTGKDFDIILEKHGGKRILNRVDCDVDYDDVSEKWILDSLDEFTRILKAENVDLSEEMPNVPVNSKTIFSKKKPFDAGLINRVLLNGRGSDKETYHIELSLEGSRMEYEPGDSLGVYSVNDEKLVNMIINHLNLNPYDKIETYNGIRELNEALLKMYELSVLSAEVMKKYALLSPNRSLEELLQNATKLEQYLYGRDILDLITDFPISGITANELINILRKLPARLYSISSSIKLHPNEVHITVAAVRYNLNGRERYGVCSTFLADKVGPEIKVPVYIEKNKAFKLPDNKDIPIIMIGPGTGIAPFRAFIEERSIEGKGKNWLFYGDQHFTTDFLYQLEWQRYMKNKNLYKLDVAFSRDQADKIYVQNRMLENSREIYKWITDGAHFYVCGDEKRMSKDVHMTLVEIIKTEGGITLEKAEEYVKNMQKYKRYQEDVY